MTRLTCPICGPTEALEGQYLTDFSEAHGHYDGYDCLKCRTFWTLEELDATSQYRQAFIDGDEGAEWVRRKAQDTTTV